MISTFVTKIIGTKHERDVKRLRPRVAEINALEPSIRPLTDAELRGKTAEFRAELAAGKPLDDLLVPAFAVVREAARRTLDMRHFDVQLIGGMVLHEGKIAEMRTGEGKTLVATLPAYLNALPGRGVHIVTVNEYLAQRDSEWMGQIYRFLGMSVGVIQHDISDAERKAAYLCDITYGTNNELGFDYLRDNMKFELASMVQRPHHFAIVDEVDSILIDEARTPLIISGPSEESVDKYYTIDRIIPKLEQGEEIEDANGDKRTTGDFVVDEKGHSASLTETGVTKVERLLGIDNLYDMENMDLLHGVNQGLRAHHLYKRDVEYLIKDGQVVIVDEFTGRMMPGRRWSDGLHQAVEAKEGVKIERENQTLATITFQNYFRMYGKLAGMTGTADTEAYEFQEIYGLETLVVPTHQPMVRDDREDLVYQTIKEKNDAIIAAIKHCYEHDQPVLVGTTSIENSELLSGMLEKEKLPHQVLNAKQHAREAEIVVQAGSPKMVTIATNMAGRGTDIVLGGNVEKTIDILRATEGVDEAEKERRIQTLREEWQQLHAKVIAAGGLHIIGTERHESRRIDNQLRGRSGRQGDPGSSRFYLSLEDPLLRIFAGDKVKSIMQRLKMPEGEAIESSWVSRSIESAQRKVEAHNFDIRKQLLEYDDVANDQRKVIYEQRNELLESADVSETITSLRQGVVSDIFRAHVPPESMEEQWDVPGLEKAYAAELQFAIPLKSWLEADANLDDQALLEKAVAEADRLYREKFALAPAEALHQYERWVMLTSLDQHWREHLAALDHLRQGIHLRGYAQKNPKQEYKREAFELFASMLESVKLEVTRTLTAVQVSSETELAEAAAETAPAVENVKYQHAGYDEALAADAAVAEEKAKERPFVREMGKIGRNDPCPCGSGKKYKQCHGKLT